MKHILEAFNNKRVLVVGDVMIDAYYFGRVERISPEAPVPIVSVEKKENRLGGAANVAMNLISLGALPVMCTVIGKDQEGDEMLELLKKQGIDTRGVIRSANRITTVKTRVISQQTQMLRIDHELISPIDSEDSQQLINALTVQLKDADVLIFQDYDKGVLTHENIKEITQAAKRAGVSVVVDPKKRNFNHFEGAYLFKPNLKELRDGLKLDLDPDNQDEFEKIISGFMRSMHISNMMITMSERGVMITDGKTFDYIPAHIRKIADVSGAGDTVISVAALCVANGWSNRKVAEYSNLAGGLVCEEVGVVPIDKQKLAEEIDQLKLA